jgi:2-hydroxy-6-oxonona-2,4-dienedioate hydrolase
MHKKIWRYIGIGVLLIFVIVFALYAKDMNKSYERVTDKSTVITTPYGNVEYTEGGQGIPVLIVHGSGGGFDQGELIAEAFLDDSFHWIAPSRFGYLQSTFNEGETFDDQARAYAALLDHLGIEKVAVVAFSHGGPSALLFAVLYPERVSSLTLVSTGVASSNEGNQEEANKKGSALVTVFKHDWLYWGVTKLFKNQFMGLMGANETVIAGLTAEQLDLVARVIDDMNPVSRRTPGVLFDNEAKLPNERIAAIQAPTLIIHAADDSLQIFHNAEFADEYIPNSKLMRFEKGGHLLMVIEQSTIRSAVQKHIEENFKDYGE